MIWCVIILTAALESDAPKMCFPERETCLAYIAAMDLSAAQCNRRSK